MPLLVLVIAALVSGLGVAAIARRHPHLERPLLLLVVGGGLVLGVLAVVIRTDADAIGLDVSAANWGDRHATDLSTDLLDAITRLGQPRSIVVLAGALAIVETIRSRSAWPALFLLAIVAGNGVLTTTLKQLADRVRPALNPIAETLGPSFPSGHASWSAAFFAAAALLLGHGGGRTARVVLAGLAAGLAVAIAASRVLLDVHWLSDVVAGLALGWAWFAICAIAFRRRGVVGIGGEAARERSGRRRGRSVFSRA
jgi:undecaprenyl-diphosphatase